MELLAGAVLVVGVLWFVARMYGSVPEGQRKELNVATVKGAHSTLHWLPKAITFPFRFVLWLFLGIPISRAGRVRR